MQVVSGRAEISGGQKQLFFQQLNEELMESTVQSVHEPQAFYSIPDLAERWRCSRGTVYNVIRGERVLDLAANGKKKKSHKLIPFDVVQQIERDKLRVFR